MRESREYVNWESSLQGHIASCGCVSDRTYVPNSQLKITTAASCFELGSVLELSAHYFILILTTALGGKV